jgi:Holliday junction resolvase RusA-like endonuclease
LSEHLTFSIAGEPIPKARPRFASHRGRITVRTPEKSNSYHKQAQTAAWLEMRGRQKFSGPVAVEARFVFRPPPSWPERRRAEAFGRPHVQRPDLDNLVKQILDAMNAVVFGDDATVTEIKATKTWGPAGIAVCTVREVAGS